MPDYGKKRTHDITIIKRASKILYVWDKACIDDQVWSNLKQTAGVYFITRKKSNSTATASSKNLIEPTDPSITTGRSFTMILPFHAKPGIGLIEDSEAKAIKFQGHDTSVQF